MKRDLELMRKILIAIADRDGTRPTRGDELAPTLGSEVRVVNHHLDLLHRAGWIETMGLPHRSHRTADTVPDLVLVSSLTNEGHAFLDAVRDEASWGRFIKTWGAKLAEASLSVILGWALSSGGA